MHAKSVNTQMKNGLVGNEQVVLVHGLGRAVGVLVQGPGASMAWCTCIKA